MFTTEIRRPNELEVLGQPNQEAALYDPTTRAGVRSYVNEAWQGVGTGYALKNAMDVKEAERTGSFITEDEYKSAPALQSEGVSWYEGMTLESAQISKEYNDQRVKNQKIISDLSTGQSIVGFTAGFVSGVAEPQNVATGVATSMALGPLGEAGVMGNLARRMYQMKKTALRARVGIGATEGVVAGALVEPTNRYSARTLQQDYTMADSLFNVATSTAFGAALPAASSFIKTKIDKFRGRTMDVVAAEIDIATQQFTAGQRVDVSAVEAAEIGKMADKPVAVQVRAAESFVRFNESPEFKARFEGSKVVDEVGKPMMVYHGTKESFDQFDTATIKNDRGFWFAGAPEKASGFAMAERVGARGDGANVRPAYLRLENPYVHTPELKMTMDKIFDAAKKGGHDGIIFRGKEGSQGAMVAFSPNQIIPAFGDKSLADIIAQAESANTTTIQKHNASTIDPRNDTLIDYDTIDAMDERRAITQVEGQAEAEAYLAEAEAEIQQMLDQDVLNEADLAEYQSALEELNSSDTKDALNILHTCLTRG